MHAKPRWGSMPLSGLLPRIPAKASKYASRTAPPVFLSAFGTRCSIRSSAMENLTARGWALLLSARSYKTILVLCPSSRLRNAEPPSSYDCLFHINPPPTVIGQCVAAAHVAKNLDIPGGFDALKAKVTGSGAVSLGTAIKGFAPNADVKAETKKANKQASDDQKETSP